MLSNIGREGEPILVGKELKDDAFLTQYKEIFKKLLANEPVSFLYLFFPFFPLSLSLLLTLLSSNIMN